MQSSLRRLKSAVFPTFLRGAAALALAILLCASPRAADAAAETILFIDDHDIDSLRGIVRVVDQPVKRAAPVITAGPRWERNPYLFGSVLWDDSEQIFKMWYMSYNYGDPVEVRTPVLYATSKDGLKWDRPELGLVEYEGSKANNILFLSYGVIDQYSPSVVHDVKAKDPARRYKMAIWDSAKSKDSYQGAGMHVRFSPDGINWTRYGDEALLRAAKKENATSDVMDVMHDPVTGKFLLFAKGWEKSSWDQPDTQQRIIVRSESTDFVNWTTPQVVMRHAFTRSDPQSYGMPVFHYEGVYIGLLRSYKLPGDERADIRLAVSRDSVNWRLVTPEHTFIPTSESDSAWDDGMILGAAAPVIRGDRMLFYYGGWDGPHNSRIRRAGIGLAELPLGRFAALTSGRKRSGQVTTRLLDGGAREVLVNAAIGTGKLRVAVVDEAGQAIAGYGDEDCEVQGDGLRLPVRWNENSRLPDRGKVRLVFDIEGDAKLYGIQLVSSSERPTAPTSIRTK